MKGLLSDGGKRIVSCSCSVLAYAKTSISRTHAVIIRGEGIFRRGGGGWIDPGWSSALPLLISLLATPLSFLQRLHVCVCVYRCVVHPLHYNRTNKEEEGGKDDNDSGGGGWLPIRPKLSLRPGAPLSEILASILLTTRD